MSEHKIKEVLMDLIDYVLKRDMLVKVLKKEIEVASKKYYSELEIK